jgi:hypothetical protein
MYNLPGILGNDWIHWRLDMDVAKTPNEAFLRRLPVKCLMWLSSKLLNGESL